MTDKYTLVIELNAGEVHCHADAIYSGGSPEQRKMALLSVIRDYGHAVSLTRTQRMATNIEV